MGESERTALTVRFPNGKELPGNGPVILLGPNGAGKSRLSTKISGSPLARIPALRNISQISDIPFQPPKQALDQLSAQAREQFNNIWQLANDGHFCLSTILANHARAAEEYCAAARIAKKADKPPPETQLTALLDLWEDLFPGRKLMFEEHQPWVSNSHRGGDAARYRAHTMSDGERVALYVAARVLLAPAGLIVVDEPELHLHSLLARRLWTLLQDTRSDCRFVYITHDLPFAFSRRDAAFVLVRSEDDYQIVDRQQAIPDDVFRDTIGAATLTISASKTVFCEGSPGKDDSLYDALLARDGAQVVAVGSCADVEQCVEAFRDNRIVRGGEAYGIVDRDFSSAAYREALAAKGVRTLAVHEVESLYVLPSCFAAVAVQLKFANANDAYSEFLNRARRQAANDLVRVITERTKQRVYGHLARHLDKISTTDPASARAGLVGEYQARVASIDVGVIFDEERTAVEAALGGGPDTLLAIFPAKALVGIAAGLLGVKQERYVDLLEALIREEKDDSPAIKDLRSAIGI